MMRRMKARAVLGLLAIAAAAACAGETGAGADAAVAADAAVDAAPEGPLGLRAGTTYALAWECREGCAPLPFPPGTYTHLAIDDALVARWFTDGTTNERVAQASADDQDGVTVEPLVYSTGATAPIRFRAAVGGPLAEVVYTASAVESISTYEVKAAPAAGQP